MKFDELQVGQKFTSKPWKIGEDEIREFAAKYDPQDLHLDEEWAAQGPFGKIIASGLMTVSIAWSQWINTGIPGKDQLGGIALNNLQWLKPVFIGDELTTEITISELRKTSKSNNAINGLSFEVRNQKGEVVLKFETIGLLAV